MAPPSAAAATSGAYKHILKKPGGAVEHFFTDSWPEHLRHPERVIVTDPEVQERANACHKGVAQLRVSHLAARVLRTVRARPL